LKKEKRSDEFGENIPAFYGFACSRSKVVGLIRKTESVNRIPENFERRYKAESRRVGTPPDWKRLRKLTGTWTSDSF